MMVEIKGYYGHDVHMINIDAVQSVSFSSPRHSSSSDNRELIINFTRSQLIIDFLSYVERGRREYDIIIEAMRVNHKQYISNKSEV